MSAIPGELTLLRERLDRDTVSDLEGRRIDRGRLGGREVVLLESGIGKVNAAIVTTLLISRHRPSTILFTGVAGGLDPGLGVGDVVIGQRTIQHDAGVLADQRIDTYQAGHLPFFNPADRLGYFPSPILFEAARRAVEGMELGEVAGRMPSVVVGTILTGDQFLNCGATRDRLHDELGGQAIEMEGGAVAQTAQAFGVDCLVVRALSDLAGAESDLDFTTFLDEVAANSAVVVERIVRELGT